MGCNHLVDHEAALSKVRSIEKEARRALVVGAKWGVVCKICTRPVTIKYNGGNAAHRGILFTCPVHGTLNEGERYITGYNAVFGGDGNG